MIYIELLYIFFKIGLFSFGGGYAVLALIQKDVIETYSWLSFSEFTEIVALSQITPGPISINLATHVGYKVAGTLGSTLATVGVVLPSFFIIIIIIIFLKKFSDLVIVKRALKALKIAVVGLILGAALSLFVKENFIDFKSYIILFSVFIAGWYYNVSSLLLILLSGFAGILLYYFF
ncbi:chromate transporter [Fusobacterium russii]|uniref:chromate transporter n=1 Tax=Fusobacterium russii TaxID=854 RepID=UPI0003A1A59F|nr:chromate transporter [Fusobacterium russii]